MKHAEFGGWKKKGCRKKKKERVGVSLSLSLAFFVPLGKTKLTLKQKKEKICCVYYPREQNKETPSVPRSFPLRLPPQGKRRRDRRNKKRVFFFFFFPLVDRNRRHRRAQRVGAHLGLDRGGLLLVGEVGVDEGGHPRVARVELLFFLGRRGDGLFFFFGFLFLVLF